MRRGEQLRLLVLAGLVATFLVLTALPVFAHAQIETSEPANGAVLERAPPRVTARYTEPLEPRFSELRVVDASGRQVDSADVVIAGIDMSVGLMPDLPNGTYVAQYRTVSTVDGHTVRGSFVFAVGEPIAGGVGAQATALDLPGPTPFGTLVKWLGYACLALITGLLLLRFVLLRHADWSAAALRRLGSLTVLVVIVFAAVTVLQLLDQAMRSAGVNLVDALSGPVWTTLLQTRYGYTIIARLALLAALFFLADELLFQPGGERDRSRGLWVATLLGAVEVGALAAMMALTGHAAATGSWLQTALDLVHLVAMALWFGGLAVVLLVLPRLDGARADWPPLDDYRRLMDRFSPIALGAVLVLGVTGLYQSAALVGSFGALWSTSYGFTLLVKLVLFAALIGLGAVNLLWWRPRLSRETDAAAARRGLTRSLVAETGLAIAVLVAVALLTNLQPSRPFQTSAVGPSAQVQQQTVDGLNVAFAYDPARLANARYQVTLSEGPFAVSDAERVTLRWRNLLAPLGQSEGVAEPLGYGIYTVAGTFTPLDGFWEAQVIVRRPDRLDTVVEFIYPVGRSTQFAGAEWTLPPLDGLTFAGIGLLLLAILVLRWRTRLNRQTWRTGAMLLSFGLFFAGGILLTSHAHSPVEATALAVNPVRRGEESLAAGRALYEAQCLACHGVGGRGNGPLARSLSPPPLDLTIHAPLHTDGELYGWITQGVPGTSMLGFADRLSPTERWHLVNYLRSLTTPTDR